VILIVLESVPARALGCVGAARNVSPNIDRIAAGGALFDNCIATASFSAYGQISLFTSLHMLRYETNDHFKTVDYPHMCLHALCKLRDYELAAFSSANEAFENIDNFYAPDAFDTWFTRNTAPIPESEHFDANRMDDRHATDAFVAWLAERERDRPFFCYINLQSTHFDYWVPEPWASHFQPTLDWLSSGNGIVRIPPEQLPSVRNQFDNALRYLDHCVGRIHTAVENNSYVDDSIVVLIGDHGEAFMEHGVARHGLNLYQEVLTVPLIISAPGWVSPMRRSDPVSQLDVNPTVTGLLGLRPHPSWQGVDVFADGYDGRSRPMFSVLQLSRMQEAVQYEGWKYIYDFSDCRDRLFNLDTDPGEQRNLIRAEPAQRATMRHLLGAYHTHQLRYYADRSRVQREYIGELPVAGVVPDTGQQATESVN
jgi:arylsulfatase A-like enzyme